jgi:uncharacterized protein (TIGR02231 family)
MVRQTELLNKRPYNDEFTLRFRGTGAPGAATRSGPILIEAATSAARWNVRYDMDLNSETGAVVAKMRAQAWQKTGMDVKGEFSFHTRHPSSAVNPYEVTPLRVDLRKPQPQPVARVDRDFTMAMAPARAAAPKRERAVDSLYEFSNETPAPVVNLTPVNIAVKGAGELKGDGTQEDIALGTFQLQSDVLLVSIPEQNSETWIIASMDHSSSSTSPATPLLPGPADLSVDGAVSGKTNIPAIGLQEQIPFGMASRVTSRKSPLVSKTGTSWIGKGILEDGYTLAITNGMETAQTVLVKDRIPIPVNEKIQIEVKKIEPAPTERDPENRLTWKIDVQPGETRQIVVEFTLRYPGDETLEYR